MKLVLLCYLRIENDIIPSNNLVLTPLEFLALTAKFHIFYCLWIQNYTNLACGIMTAAGEKCKLH